MRFTFYKKTFLGNGMQEGCPEWCELVAELIRLEAFTVIPARKDESMSQSRGREMRSREDLSKGIS